MDNATQRARKQALRAWAAAARAELPPAALTAASAAVTARLLDLPELAGARTIAAFVSYGSELATQPLLEALSARGVAVLLPVLRDDDDLTWRLYAGPDRLVPGRRGLLEPAAGADQDPGADPGVETVDAVVVPGLCYDESGRRLGRGGGSYDRALARVPAGVPRIAVALDHEIVAEVPAEEHDQRVDVIVTPTRVVRTSGGTR